MQAELVDSSIPLINSSAHRLRGGQRAILIQCDHWEDFVA